MVSSGICYLEFLKCQGSTVVPLNEKWLEGPLELSSSKKFFYCINPHCSEWHENTVQLPTKTHKKYKYFHPV